MRIRTELRIGSGNVQTIFGRGLMEDFRACARAGMALAAVLAVSVVSGSAYGAGAAPDISGTYWANQYNAKLQIVGGGDLPLNANQLEDVITIHDPDYYTKDFSARFVYNLRNEIRLEDYVCGEKHRDLTSVRGVRRP